MLYLSLISAAFVAPDVAARNAAAARAGRVQLSTVARNPNLGKLQGARSARR
jgi:hypothetical protein